MRWVLSAIIAVVLGLATSYLMEFRMEPEGFKAFCRRALLFFPVYFVVALIIIRFIGFIF